MLCAVALVLLAAGEAPQRAQAAYLDPYIERVTALGLMRGDIDGNLMPDSDISRAEFVTIVNRAFGYDEMGGAPFDDVPEDAWYAEDVDIGYTAGYIAGTSESTFSPLAPVTREQAAVMLARNLVMQPNVGENISFTDGRDLSAWSRGLVSTAAQYNLISGYPDGSFHPQSAITRGEAAIMLLNAVGTPIQEPGVQSLGNVWGNVTITTSGVTLRDTVVGGNLYITAGVGLGDVILENVTVLGEIVVSGGGVSEQGDDSVVLRNVNAPTLIVDNIKNQHVSLRVEGDGVIDNASIRTDAYLVDNAPSNAGVLRMELNGEEGLRLTLGGNIKEVVNKTPESTLSVSSGQAAVITVDEAATGSLLEIASGAEVGTVNLDTGTDVTGDGDIGNLVVNAPGSTVSMLPDQITIRPGVTATIDGETMDNEAAAEASADPRLLAGYPQITDLAPTTATAQFSGNKRGTVYWAITSVTDGSVGTADLISPPSYTTNIVANGTVSLSGANQPATVQITKLTSDGSYYLSTVMVDARGDQSPLKVISFTTPDDTKPDFASGYPYMSKITNISAQVTAMPTKTCRLYWAVLPKGATAPTASDFKANAVTGNLGFGTLDVTKNTEYTFDVNNVPLEELESYDLYLWLTDVEGGQSSAVKKLSFTTVDKTPPVFNTEPTINKVDRTSVGMYANLNEAGTLYWVVVAQGEEYPKPLAGQSGAVDLSSDTAKLQVSAGMNALKSGKVSMTEGRDVTFNVSGLEAEKAYDLYYVAQDKAGNYSATVKKITIHTLDPNAPTVTQEFTKYNGDDKNTPLPNTDIRLVFSEAIQDAATNTAYVDLYQAVTQAAEGAAKDAARETMANVLRNSIKLYVDTGNGRPEVVPEATSATNKATDEWIIDYRYAEITLEEGKTVVTFPTKSAVVSSGLNLESGAEYYFEIGAGTIADTSGTKNIMGKTTLEHFKTVFAIVNLSNPNITSLGSEVMDENNKDKRVDVSWTLSPMTTESTADNIDWDMVIWSDTSAAFELYYRNTERDAETGALLHPDWELLGSYTVTVPDGTDRIGVSLTRHFLDPSNAPDFAQLNTLKENAEYEYAIHFTQIGSLTDPDTWSQRLNIGVNILAGDTNSLQTLANNLSVDNYEAMVPSKLTNIGQPDDFNLIKQFSDQTAPTFAGGTPTFTAGDSIVEMSLMLDRPGTIYYVVAPRGTITTRGIEDGSSDVLDYTQEINGQDNYDLLPQVGEFTNNGMTFEYKRSISNPAVLDIVNASDTYGSSNRIRFGSINAPAAQIQETVKELEANQEYIVYFVLKGNSNQTYSEVYAYRFETGDVTKPVITLQELSPDVAYKTSEDSDLNMVLFAGNQLPTIFNRKFIDYVDTQKESDFRNAAGNDADTLTVLAALLKSGIGGYSWFDLYADFGDETSGAQTVRNTVSQIVLRGQGEGGNPGATFSDETKANVEESHDFTSNMDPNSATTYYCIAVAKNVLGGDYSFKAVANVHIPDTTPPEMDAPGGVGYQETGKNTFKGDLYLTFSEVVYWIPESGDTKEICEVWNNSNYSTNDAPATIDSEGNVVPGHVAILAHMGGASSRLKPLTSSGKASSTFEFHYSGVNIGDTLTLFSDGYIADKNGVSTRAKIQLRFEATDTGVTGFAQAGKWVIVE